MFTKAQSRCSEKQNSKQQNKGSSAPHDVNNIERMQVPELWWQTSSSLFV